MNAQLMARQVSLKDEKREKSSLQESGWVSGGRTKENEAWEAIE